MAMRATTFNHVSIRARTLAVSMWFYMARDPADNLLEVDWPDVTTLDTSVVTDIPKLADEVPQTEDAVRATLFLAG